MSKQTTETLKKIMDGRVRLERRNANPMIYARAYLQGKDVVFRTNQTAPHLAQEVAENWYLEQRERIKKGEKIHGRLFADVADAFLKWVDEHRRGEISDGQIEQYTIKWKVLKPEFTDIKVTDVDGKFLVDLRDKRSKKVTQFKRTVTPATIQKDFVFIRLVLKHAKYEEKCLTEIPPFPAFQGPKFSIANNPTPYLTLPQYNTLTGMGIVGTRKVDLRLSGHGGKR